MNALAFAQSLVSESIAPTVPKLIKHKDNLEGDGRTFKESIHDYRDQQGNKTTRKVVAETMDISSNTVGTLYQRFDDDWKYIYANYGSTKIINIKKGTGYRINYRDADGSTSSLSELMERYGVSEKTVMRAFVKYDRDHWLANEYLCERHLVTKEQRIPSDNYNFKDYRDQYGNPSTRKAVAAIMKLSNGYISYLYDTHENNWKFIYDNFGQTKINTEATL